MKMLKKIIFQQRTKVVISLLLSWSIVSFLSGGENLTPKILAFKIISHSINLPVIAKIEPIQQLGNGMIKTVFAKEQPLERRKLFYNGEYFAIKLDPEITLTPELTKIFYENYKLSQQLNTYNSY